MPPVATPSERWLDGIVHVISVALALAAVTTLLVRAVPIGDGAVIAAVTIYGLGLLASFGLSAAYNITWAPAWKARLRRLDHAAIFLLIAGTYTPFALVSLAGPVGYTLLAVVWTVAVGGLALKLARPGRYERLSLALYLALGWTGLAAAGSLVAALPPAALGLLLAGGILYSAGVLFYVAKRLRFNRAIWHTFVLAAAVCHYVAVSESVFAG
ncbi:PAQR family membrane homeostasis protein TrhA [Roseospira goensis]|uniref:Hemolysin III n=1 Tax=Roseospira goensis TaxID=391922 RepID=A0A7W6WK27_9PROT|nr:hemolysin III family protein [Roseospira goensis]MBB4285329.1 hemolysin III [Roseospira goensis]